VDYGAVVEALERGALRGAVLDVFDPEPPPHDAAVWRAPNLLMTPHVSSDPRDYPERVAAILVDNLQRFVAGRPLRNRVDPVRGY
jgi:glyoxylate/hydroxypyruvate reductase